METELKLLLAPQDLRRLRRDPRIKALQQGRAATRRVHSVYYDTPERALLRAGLALRLRSDGGRWLQTLKTEGQAAAGLHLREEWEWPLPGEALDFGLLATTPEAKVFRAPRLRAALAPAFATEFTRTSLRLGFADGSLAELCLDSGEIRSGRRASKISEAEIELLAGSPVRLFELALELAERVPLRLGHASKAERGYALARGLPARPVKAAPPALDPQGSVAAAFSAIVHGCIAQLQANESGFLAGKDPEYLHQLRVALRRLRAGFSLFKTAIPQPAFAPFMDRLREQNKALGEARDWDVFVHEMLRALRAQRSDEAGVAAFERRCVRMGRARLRAAQAIVASPAWQRLWLEFGRLLAEGAWMQEQPALALPVGEFSAEPAAAARRHPEEARQTPAGTGCRGTPSPAHRGEEAALCGGVLRRAVSEAARAPLRAIACRGAGRARGAERCGDIAAPAGGGARRRTRARRARRRHDPGLERGQHASAARRASPRVGSLAAAKAVLEMIAGEFVCLVVFHNVSVKV